MGRIVRGMDSSPEGRKTPTLAHPDVIGAGPRSTRGGDKRGEAGIVLPMRRVCFLTGTRAEFGLMRSVLREIQSHRGLTLQIIATGMHLDRSRGQTIKQIRKEGWRVDAIAPWKRDVPPAIATGSAMAAIAAALSRLKSDIVLVVGDRVEAFAGAAAGAIGGRVVAHVHGGDRALGQVDDSLRHAITKLAHIHFPATATSAKRIERLGEEKWRIHCVGSPGLDGILDEAATAKTVAEICPQPFALLVLHPVDGNVAAEKRRAEMILNATLAGIGGREGKDPHPRPHLRQAQGRLPEYRQREQQVGRVVIIHPNNDPGSNGIVAAWAAASRDGRCVVKTNVPRSQFLGLLRDAALLVGNSSAGIIEAASFGTPVVDIGPRQMGRERGGNVQHVACERAKIAAAIENIWNNARPKRKIAENIYSLGVERADGAGRKIADILGRAALDGRLRRKLISY